MKEEIATIFQEHHGRYGAIRITKLLNKKGMLVNRKRVEKLLHQLGLYAKGSTYKSKYYNRKSPSLSQLNLVNQTFKATDKNKIRCFYYCLILRVTGSVPFCVRSFLIHSVAGLF